MIVWLNGTFGAGKTSTANELLKSWPDARLFDPEIVGFMLRHLIAEPVDDFQDWPAWRALVPETAVQLLVHYGGTLLVPMTLLRRDYASEIFSHLTARGISVAHFLLHADERELVRRIEGDEVESGARQWRLDHLSQYSQARCWLSADAQEIDTTSLSTTEVAKQIESVL